jgi:hypothetical protein
MSCSSCKAFASLALTIREILRNYAIGKVMLILFITFSYLNGSIFNPWI